MDEFCSYKPGQTKQHAMGIREREGDSMITDWRQLTQLYRRRRVGAEKGTKKIFSLLYLVGQITRKKKWSIGEGGMYDLAISQVCIIMVRVCRKYRKIIKQQKKKFRLEDTFLVFLFPEKSGGVVCMGIWTHRSEYYFSHHAIVGVHTRAVGSWH